MKPLLTLGEIALVVLVIGTLGLTLLRSTPLSPREDDRGESGDPLQVVSEAHETFQISDCIDTISPKTVLTTSQDGNPELAILEGAPVVECFPELTRFRAEHGMGSTGPNILPLQYSSGRKSLKRASNELETSVVVLPGNSPQNLRAPVPASTPAAGTSTTEIPVSVPQPISSGGGGSGSGGTPVLEPSFPSEDQFDLCRKKVFGARIPDILTPDELSQMEVCLTSSI